MESQYCFIISDSCGTSSDTCGTISITCGRISEGCGMISYTCGMISRGCGLISFSCGRVYFFGEGGFWLGKVKKNLQSRETLESGVNCGEWKVERLCGAGDQIIFCKF